MRCLFGTLSLLQGILVAGGLALASMMNRQRLPPWFHDSDKLPGAWAILTIALAVPALGMVVSGAALMLGRQWSMSLANRSATLFAVVVFCLASGAAVLESLSSGRANGETLLQCWGPGLALTAIPLIVVWWTGRHMHDPVESLSWKYREEQRRGRYMSGQCHQCGAWLNFASGDGLCTPVDEPFKLFCSQCQCELSLTDVAQL